MGRASAGSGAEGGRAVEVGAVQRWVSSRHATALRCASASAPVSPPPPRSLPPKLHTSPLPHTRYTPTRTRMHAYTHTPTHIRLHAHAYTPTRTRLHTRTRLLADDTYVSVELRRVPSATWADHSAKNNSAMKRYHFRGLDMQLDSVSVRVLTCVLACVEKRNESPCVLTCVCVCVSRVLGVRGLYSSPSESRHRKPPHQTAARRLALESSLRSVGAALGAGPPGQRAVTTRPVPHPTTRRSRAHTSRRRPQAAAAATASSRQPTRTHAPRAVVDTPEQVWPAVRVAAVTNRSLIVPKLACYCDKYW